MVSNGRAGGESFPGGGLPAGGCVVASRVRRFCPLPPCARLRKGGFPGGLKPLFSHRLCASEVASDATNEKRIASPRTGE